MTNDKCCRTRGCGSSHRGLLIGALREAGSLCAVRNAQTHLEAGAGAGPSMKRNVLISHRPSFGHHQVDINHRLIASTNHHNRPDLLLVAHDSRVTAVNTYACWAVVDTRIITPLSSESRNHIPPPKTTCCGTGTRHLRVLTTAHHQDSKVNSASRTHKPLHLIVTALLRICLFCPPLFTKRIQLECA